MFRWKGENVATTEVGAIIGMLDFIQEANVYGVTVPGMNRFQVWEGFLEWNETFLSFSTILLIEHFIFHILRCLSFGLAK